MATGATKSFAGDLGYATELLRLRASPNLLMNGTLRRWIPAKLQPHPISWALYGRSIEAHPAAAQVFHPSRRTEHTHYGVLTDGNGRRGMNFALFYTTVSQRRSTRIPQLHLALREPPRWGGRRRGAGRKSGPQPRISHRSRVDVVRLGRGGWATGMLAAIRSTYPQTPHIQPTRNPEEPSR